MSKKVLLCLLILSSFLNFSAWAQLERYDNDDLSLNEILTDLSEVKAPQLHNDFVVFTADKNARYVGIAFDFENYNQIHSFQLRNTRDEDYEISSSVYFYVLKLSKDIQSFNYRLIVDGIWTTDPTNPSKIYDVNTGILLSHMDVTRDIPLITEDISNGLVRFIYKGTSGQTVRLGGSFTNWDSWIYQMTEIEPGIYQIELSLPPGTYDYAYYTGMNSIADNTNPLKVYTPDGKVASRITVK